ATDGSLELVVARPAADTAGSRDRPRPTGSPPISPPDKPRPINLRLTTERTVLVSAPVLLLQLSTLAVIGLLPRLFFRRDGRLGLMWWLTALPFVVCPAILLFAFFAHTPVMTWPGWRGPGELAAVLADAASLALIFFTLGTHRIPLALWHQDNDNPAHIVTYGAYGPIRHPFYASVILTF